MSWWVVINPRAGRKGEVASRVRRALQARALDHEINVSESADHVRALVDTGVAAGYRRFLAVGGDGTANVVVDGLLRHAWERRPVLGILPTGSGSDFIRTFGFPRRLEEAADRLTGDEVYTVDAGVVEGRWGARYFLNAADCGVLAATISPAERLPRRLGGLRYSLALWPALARFRASEVELEIGTRVYRGPAINVVVANGQFFGGGFNIAPKASLVDGLFDALVITGPRRQVFSLLPKVKTGTHLSHHGVRRLQGPGFGLRTSVDWPVEVDGEVIGSGAMTGRVIPAALDFKI